MSHFAMLMQHTSVCNIRTIPVKIDGEAIHVEIE